jgi:hypothetical protein
VFDQSGTLTAVARWPQGVDLTYGQVDPRGGVGVRSDSLGVQRVVTIRWDR